MDFVTLAQQCAPNVAQATLAAIVRTESGFRPNAININGEVKLERQPLNKEEAVVTAKWLIAKGYNIDMGLAQINSQNLPRLRLSVDDIFDPCKNLGAAATILGENYKNAKVTRPDNQQALYAAISAYNTGSFERGFNNGYVQRVIMNANQASPVGLDAKVLPIGVIGKSMRPAARAKPAPVMRKAQKTYRGSEPSGQSWDVFSNSPGKAAFD